MNTRVLVFGLGFVSFRFVLFRFCWLPLIDFAMKIQEALWMYNREDSGDREQASQQASQQASLKEEKKQLVSNAMAASVEARVFSRERKDGPG